MRCNIDKLIGKIGVDKLSKEIEVSFALHRNLPDCRKINTRFYVAATEEGTHTYNSLRKPKNQFECMRKGCVNSGTLMAAAANDAITFKAQYDATEYNSGAVSFYVYVGNAAPVAVTFKIGESQALTNADVYTKTITAAEVKEDGFAPVVIDLSQAPDSTSGNGWTPGAVSYIQLSADKVVGYSSIAIYDTIEEFLINDVVKVGCLSTIGGTFDIPSVASTCLNAGYDDSADSFTYNVEGTTVTPNYWKLNPLIGKGTETEGFEIVTVEKTGVASGDYAKVTLSDLYQDECGYVTVQKVDECNVTDSFMYQLSVPNLTALTEDQFQIVKNADGTTDLYFNSAAVDAKLLISYPRNAEVVEEVLSSDNIGETRVRMTVPVDTTDGVKYLYTFDNVLITSFPFTINNTSETTFSFTITIQRDEEGFFARRRRIVA